MSQLALSPPSQQGVLAERVQDFVDALGCRPGVEAHGLVVLRHGQVVAEGYWHPYSAERLHLLYSLSKSFTSTAAGLAVGEGLLRPDDPVISYFPEIEPHVSDSRSRSMRVRDIAAMASGHLADTVDRVIVPGARDPVLEFLRLPPERDPGTVFAYNQPCTYVLGAIVQRLTGETLTKYIRRRLLDKLGASGTRWVQYPAGTDLAFSGLHATTRTVALLGQFYLQGGNWRGEQLLPPGWHKEATSARISTHADTRGDGLEPDPDWGQGYGYQFWMSRHGYRGDGAFGQFCLVLPEQDAVVAITGQSPEGQPVLDLVWDKLLPAFTGSALPSASAAAADDRLRERLARLALTARCPSASPTQDAPAWDGAKFAPDTHVASQQPSLTSVTVERTGDGDWDLVLGEPGSQLRARMSPDGWAVTEPALASGDAGYSGPVACNGGWSGEGTLQADVIFLETPHRLCLTCSRGTGTFGAAWVTAPLHARSLRELRAGGVMSLPTNMQH